VAVATVEQKFRQGQTLARRPQAGHPKTVESMAEWALELRVHWELHPGIFSGIMYSC
jgi:hypothetical protein